ncbi:hypothetical protein [Qipengyuania sphaerica]|uniref:hypothetical protein n=1 Tax=Qipengyuania sphaerica TaxID=2867243 RepID=UPI001C873AED|nr:hypothetical protein [Qipengyuania sphaerica]MBX7540582.1 hypothetical protein [Qipengyuania sphaerica]
MRLLAASAALAAIAVAGCGTIHEPLAVSMPAPAPAEWRAVDAATGQIRDIDGLTALAAAFPDSSSVRLRLLNAQLEAGEIEALLGTLQWLNERGYVFSEVARGQIPKLVGNDYAERARSLLLPPAKPVGSSDVAWTVPAEAGLVESVLPDLDTGKVAVTSVTGRSIWSTGPGEEWSALHPEGADNLSGIVYDNLTGEIWVTSGNIDQSDGPERGFSGLIGLFGGARIAAPEGAILSDLHRTPEGMIYASDPIGGAVYRFGKDRETIETLVAPGTFRSPQGLAASADGSRLYVSDYRYGIAIIDLATGEVSRLGAHIPVILDGTDAMFRHGNALIAIQNGTSPMRISRFDLSEDGNRVTGHEVLEQANPDWTEPLSGYLGKDALYYIGNGQWDRYVAGHLGEGKQPDPVQIRRLPLD